MAKIMQKLKDVQATMNTELQYYRKSRSKNLFRYVNN